MINVTATDEFHQKLIETLALIGLQCSTARVGGGEDRAIVRYVPHSENKIDLLLEILLGCANCKNSGIYHIHMSEEQGATI